MVLKCEQVATAISDGNNFEYQQHGTVIRGIHEAHPDSQTDCTQGSKVEEKCYVTWKLQNTISSKPATLLANVHHVDNLKGNKIDYVFFCKSGSLKSIESAKPREELTTRV